MDRATSACKNSIFTIEDQFVEVNKLTKHGKNVKHHIIDRVIPACKNGLFNIVDQFPEVEKLIERGKIIAFRASSH